VAALGEFPKNLENLKKLKTGDSPNPELRIQLAEASAA
jgi:hypothetical protein